MHDCIENTSGPHERPIRDVKEFTDQALCPEQLQGLESRIEEQGALLSALRFSVMKEMQMIRLLTEPSTS